MNSLRGEFLNSDLGRSHGSIEFSLQGLLRMPAAAVHERRVRRVGVLRALRVGLDAGSTRGGVGCGDLATSVPASIRFR